MAEVVLKNIKKVYPHSGEKEKKKKAKGNCFARASVS